MAIAKRNNELYTENKRKPIPLRVLPKEISNLILHLRDEAHRFAISYHKKLRKKSLLPEG
jgi:excinuclease ABC subunit C